jgi:hypothetical protein
MKIRNLIDFLIFIFYLQYFINLYIKKIKKQLAICIKHNLYDCAECNN